MESVKTRQRLQQYSSQSLRIYRVDRLSSLTIPSLYLTVSCILSLAATSCKLEKTPEPTTRQRVAVVAADKPIESGEEWCDVYHTRGKAPKLALPEVEAARAGGAISSPAEKRWVWLNLWATWCGPCLREMPLIDKWVTNLNRTGYEMDLWFLSIDEEREVLQKFFNKHKDLAQKNSLRLTKPDALPPWMSKYGLKPDTAIPINFLVAPGLEVRCIRTGSISDSDFPIVRALVKAETKS